MKHAIVLLLLLMKLSNAYSQIDEYEFRLASYLAEFNKNGFKDAVRDNLLDNTSILNDQIKFQIGLKNINDPEYRRYQATQKKIGAFEGFLRLFTNTAGRMCEYEDFIFVMSLLNRIPRELPHLKCDMVTFYELNLFNGLRAVVAHSHYRRVDITGNPLIEVTYYVNDQGKTIRGGFFNLGPNLVRTVRYLSDGSTFYPEIVNVQCTRIQ